MSALLSIDPGAPHVGAALWVEYDGRWVCRRARELTPEEYGDLIRDFCDNRKVELVAYETFRLGGGQEALQQKGSTFGTVECIGLARHFCRWNGIGFIPIERGVRRATLMRMKAVRWGFPRGASDHVRDAIAVGASALNWRAADHHDGDGVERA